MKVWLAGIKKMGIDYSVLGLRTKENVEFINYFNFVQTEAQKRDMTFFLDCAEGCEILFRDMEVVDLSGWLLPNKKVDEFKEVWQQFRENDEWVDYFCFAEQEIVDNKLKIDFKYY